MSISNFASVMAEFKWFLILAIALTTTPIVAQTNAPTNGDLDLEVLELGETHWHGIYIGNRKSGYMKSGFRIKEKPAGKVIASETKTQLKLLVQGRPSNVLTEEIFEFDTEKPYQMLRGFSLVKRQGTTTIEATVQNRMLSAQIREAGSIRTQTLGNFDYSLKQHLAYSTIDFATAEPGQQYAFRQFAINGLKFNPLSLRYIGRKQSTINGVKTNYHEADVTSTDHNSTARFRFGSNNELLFAMIGSAFEMRKETKANARNFGFSADLAVLGVLKLNQSIGMPGQIRSMVLRVTPTVASAISAGPRQSIESTGSSYLLKLGRQYGVQQSATANQTQLCLQETVEYPTSSPEIGKLLEMAIGNNGIEMDARSKTNRLVAFVSSYLADSLNDNSTSVLDIIKKRRGDCTEHARLFTTLARAAGIPAREIGGFVYMGDSVRAFGQHAWNEVIIDGIWTPVDPMWNETEINATHIQLKDLTNLYSLGSTLNLVAIEK